MLAPPRQFSQLAASFIADKRLGIPRIPFLLSFFILKVSLYGKTPSSISSSFPVFSNNIFSSRFRLRVQTSALALPLHRRSFSLRPHLRVQSYYHYPNISKFLYPFFYPHHKLNYYYPQYLTIKHLENNSW